MQSIAIPQTPRHPETVPPPLPPAVQTLLAAAYAHHDRGCCVGPDCLEHEGCACLSDLATTLVHGPWGATPFVAVRLAEYVNGMLLAVCKAVDLLAQEPIATPLERQMRALLLDRATHALTALSAAWPPGVAEALAAERQARAVWLDDADAADGDAA
jgi:hypothetical protein